MFDYQKEKKPTNLMLMKLRLHGLGLNIFNMKPWEDPFFIILATQRIRKL